MNKKMWIIIKYSLFALIATAANLGSQKLTNIYYTGLFELYAGMIVGTLVGLPIKYILDKKYIFYYKAKTKQDDLKTIVFYTAMAVITTLTTYIIEIAFDHFWTSPQARYIGGFLGLVIGYILKYNLDKKWVFNDSSA